MTHVEIFDPAMCCSTGVCGTVVDPTLSTFAADVAWLSRRGVEVTRATLAQEPELFVSNDAAREALAADGTAALPMILVDGTVKAKGAYPSRSELAAWAGVERIAIPLSQVVTAQVEGAQAPDVGCCGPSGCC